MGKMSYTWAVMRACWDVLRKNPGLMLLPVLSTIACGIITASFAAPAIYWFVHHRPMADDAADIRQYGTVVHYVVLFLFYFCNYFAMTFFNAALVACVVSRLRGGEPTIGYGLREAAARLHLIAGWALLSATVGVILRAIEERSSLVGDLVAGLLGLAWTLTSYLAVPVLVVENVGPIDALKRSAALLRKTWGERLIARVGFGAIFFLLLLPAIGLMIGAGYLAMQNRGNGAPILITAGVIAVAYAVLLALLQSTLASIFQAAVYLYAHEPELLGANQAGGHGFPVQLLADSMKVKP